MCIFAFRCLACFSFVCFVRELIRNVYTFIDSAAKARHKMMNKPE